MKQITLKQNGYDVEIDEGMSSGMRRILTLDVSRLNMLDKYFLKKDMVKRFKNFAVCKEVMLTFADHFFFVSGEMHTAWQFDVKNLAGDSDFLNDYDVEITDSFISFDNDGVHCIV